MVEVYYRRADGVIGTWQGPEGSFHLPEGAVELTAAEYETAIAEWRAEKDAYIAELQAVETTRREEDFLALQIAGIPEATARRLVGILDAV